MHAHAPAAGRLAIVLFAACGPSHLLAQGAWELPSPALSPPARTGTALTTGADGSLVLFGGEGALGLLGDTWRWDGATWSPVTTAHAPPATASHAMALDSARGRVVLFGGTGNPGTFEFDGTDWRSRSPATTPPARHGHAMTYDAARARVVLFGGLGLTDHLADTWEYDGADWTQRQTATQPSPRSLHAMAYDPRLQRTVLFGGRNGNQSLTYDTWQWDGNGWSLAWVYANIPAPRCGHAMVFHPLRFRTVLFGDNLGLGTTHEWDGMQWYPTAGTVAPAQRTAGLGLGWHAATERVVGFGGRSPLTGALLATTQQFLSVNPARSESFGTGCAGSLGVPTLGLAPWSLPWAGDFVDECIDRVPGGSFTLLVFGVRNDLFGSLPLPLDLGAWGAAGCTAYLSPLCAMQLANSGPIRHRIHLPWQAGFVGLQFYQQAFLLGAGGPHGHGMAASNALAMTYGWR